MEGAGRCYKADCQWIQRGLNIFTVQKQELLPNPELSGIGVLLGFSITAYLVLALLVLHYFTVYDYRRTNKKGKHYANDIDRGILSFVRGRTPWSPSRRFEYAMEKAVLIISDSQLVTGLAFLISGFSQLSCGISAYHWQMMIYIAWFSSFTFLSALAFLENYFMTNSSLRLLRLVSMFAMASFLVVALLPTGSHNWLQLLKDEGGFYPQLETQCYYKQMGHPSYMHRNGPKIWSMALSVVVILGSYFHAAVRLFDPTAQFTRTYFRAWPAQYITKFLHFLERKAEPRGLRAALWTIPFLSFYTAFVSIRAVYDLLESTLLEILWLTFAIAWGTVKLWATRMTANLDRFGKPRLVNRVLEEDYWTFGQTLPLVLLLLPVLSMAQTYFDNDAKAADEVYKAVQAKKKAQNAMLSAAVERKVAGFDLGYSFDGAAEEESVDPSSAFDAFRRSLRRHSVRPGRPSSTWKYPAPEKSPTISEEDGRASDLSILANRFHRPCLPQYPYFRFTRYPWYNDHIFLLLLQYCMVACLFLYFMTHNGDLWGISTFLRSRLFIIWILAIIPLASLLHLTGWYLAAWLATACGINQWLQGSKSKRNVKWWQLHRTGYALFWFLRIFWILGLLTTSFLVTAEVAGPDALFAYF